MLNPFANQLVLIAAGAVVGWCIQLAIRFVLAAHAEELDARSATLANGSASSMEGQVQTDTGGLRSSGQLLFLLALVVLLVVFSGFIRLNWIVLVASAVAGAVLSIVTMNRSGTPPEGGSAAAHPRPLLASVTSPLTTLVLVAATASASAIIVEADYTGPVAAPVGSLGATATLAPSASPTRAASATSSPTPSPSQATHVLNLVKSGGGSGSVVSRTEELVCLPRCTQIAHTYPTGQKVELGATATFGSRFVGWSAGCAEVGVCSPDMRSDQAVVGQFDLLQATGFDAKPCSDGGTLTVFAGQSASINACFANAGAQAWVRGTSSQVDLAQCCPVNVPSLLANWIQTSPDSATYASTTATVVGPGQVGMFVYRITVPKDTQPGTYTLEGRLIRRSDGAVVSGGTYAQVVQVR